MKIVKISPKGQITIPKEYRTKVDADQYMFELNGNIITLKPVRIDIIKDESKDFGRLSEKSFEFWNNEEDDIYDKFYQ